jgi:drug/metabolite transporter (DMT)-like permease
MPAPTPNPRGLLALLAGAACIGFAPIWVRWSEVGPVSTAFHRLLLALPFLAVWSARERGSAATGDRGGVPGRLRAWVIGAGIGFALDLTAWHLSIRYTTIADATLLTNLAPIFVTLGAWLFLGERAGARFFLGMAVALAGAWLLTGASLRADPGRWRGVMYGLATGFFYGCYQLCVARLRRSLSAGRVLFYSSLVSTPVLAILAIGAGESLWPASARGWLVLVGLAFTAQVLGQGLITYGFAHLSAGYSSLTLLFQPLVATLAGWQIFGERLGPGQAVGGVVLLLGLVVARFDAASGEPSRHSPARREPR